MKTATKTLVLNPFSIFSFHVSWQIFSRPVWLLSIALLISLLAFLFFQINNLAQETNSLRNLEQRLKVISQQNENWRTESTKFNHRILVESLIEELNFEKVEKIHFIPTPLEQTTALQWGYRE